MSDRVEQLRKARNLNEILSVVDDIEKELKRDMSKLSRFNSISSEFSVEYNGKTINPKADTKNPLRYRTTKIISSKISALKTPFQLLQRLYEHQYDLHAALQLIKTNYQGLKASESAIKSVTALYKETDAAINKALTEVGNHAASYAPPEFIEIAKHVESNILKSIDSSSYSDQGYYVYAAPIDKERFQFTYYISFTDLKDAQEYVHDEWILAVSAIASIKTPGIEVFVTALPRFKLPNTFNIGKPAGDEKEALKIAKSLVSYNDIQSSIDRKVMPADSSKLTSRIIDDLVSDTIIKTDSIVVVLKKKLDSSERERLISKLFALLNQVVNQGKRSQLKYSDIKYRGKSALEFILVPHGDTKDVRLNHSKLLDLQQELELTDEELKALQFALQHR